MTFKNIKNLIFDLDGTLIDSSEGVIKATNYALESLGEPVRTPKEIKRYIGYPLEEMFQIFSNKEYSEFFDRFREKAKVIMAASTRPMDGADRVLRELHRRGYNLGIGSTKISFHINGILDKFNWRDLINAFAGADDVSRVKPDPEVFVKLQRLLGGSQADTVVVGDTINDIYAARSASLPAIAVRSPFGRDGDLEKSNPDVFIDSLDELLTLLQ